MGFSTENMVRTPMCDTWVDLLDIGAGANGMLRITTAGDVVVSEHDLSAPAFAGAVNGVAVHNAIAIDLLANATGTAAKCKWYDKNNALLYTGTVTATGGGGDITFTSVSFILNIPVTIANGGTMTFPATP